MKRKIFQTLLFIFSIIILISSSIFPEPLLEMYAKIVWRLSRILEQKIDMFVFSLAILLLAIDMAIPAFIFDNVTGVFA